MFNIIFFGQDQELYDLPSTLLGKSEVINVLNCNEAEELYTLYKSNEIHLILMEVRHNAEQCKHIVQSLQALRIIDSPIILFNVSNLLEYHDLYVCGVLQIIPKSLPKVLLNSIIRTHLKYTNIKLQYSLSKAIISNDDINQNEMQFTKSLFALIQ
jgi:DNA-binding NtrC family response regulator